VLIEFDDPFSLSSQISTTLPLVFIIGGEVVETAARRVVYHWDGYPTLVLHVEAPLAYKVVEASVWQNQWFNDAVKVKAPRETADFLSAFYLFDSFKIVARDAARVVKEVWFKARRGCLFAESALPGFMWSFAIAAARFGIDAALKSLEKFAEEHGVEVNWGRLPLVRAVASALLTGV